MPKQFNEQELQDFLNQGKRRKALAHHYKVSLRTIARYIKKYNFIGVAKRGRPFLPKNPEKMSLKRFSRIWALIPEYIRLLNQEYQFVNIQAPPYHFVNQRTLVCSNQPRNPRGLFTTASIYFIVYISNVYFLFTTSIRYSANYISFKEIYEWITSSAESILEEAFRQYYIVKIVAYTFSRPKKKPRAIIYG